MKALGVYSRNNTFLQDPFIGWVQIGEVMTLLSIAKTAEEFIAVESQIEELQTKRATLVDELSRMAPEIEGEHTFDAGDYTIIVRRSERWNWSQETLRDIFSQGTGMPVFAKESISIDKRAFKKLSDKEKRVFHDALTRTLMTPTVKVEKVE